MNELFQAITARDESKVRECLLSCEDVNRENYKGLTALTFAVSLGYHDIVEILLTHGANPNHSDLIGNFALIVATNQRRPGMVNLLLDLGANINICDHHGLTPLIAALRGTGRYDIAHLLLARGANADQSTPDGKTPLMIAISQGYARQMNSADIYGRDINDPQILNDQLRMIQALLTHGAHINAQDQDGMTALMYTVKNYDTLEAAQPANTIDLNVVKNGFIRMFAKLIDCGADMSLQNNSGHTALDMIENEYGPNDDRYLDNSARYDQYRTSFYNRYERSQTAPSIASHCLFEMIGSPAGGLEDVFKTNLAPYLGVEDAQNIWELYRRNVSSGESTGLPEAPAVSPETPKNPNPRRCTIS